MDRNEVLERLDEFAAYYEGEIRECKSDWLKISYHQRSSALRAAAELIRQGGWRPISEAPENQWLFVGKRALKEWYSATMRKKWAIAHGYTHYLPEPEPPAREVPDERG